MTVIALVVSWFAAVIATPFIGAYLRREHRVAEGETHRDLYAKPFYRRLRATIEWCLVHLRTVFAATAGRPMRLAVVLAPLMIQTRSFSRSFVVFLTAPLGIVGVALALVVFAKPFGFVAMLGAIALGGMIMRNTVILVDQIDQDIAAGHPAWIAIREAAVRRFRPITLTAAAAVMPMVPLTRSVLGGPMAFAIMGGLIVGTVLTLLFVPAL